MPRMNRKDWEQLGQEATQMAIARANEDAAMSRLQEQAKQKAAFDAAEQGNIDRRLQDYLQGKMGVKPSRSFNPQSGAIGEEEGSDVKLLRYLQATEALKARQEDRDRQALERLGKRIDAQEIPAAKTLVQDLEGITPPEGQDFKSYGPYMNALPNWAVGGLETIGALPKGAYRERQVLESAKLLPRHKVFGASLTGNERASAETALGAGVGQSQEDLRATIQRLKSIPNAALRNIEQTTDPRVLQQYREQGGLKSEQPQQADPRRQRLEELRNKYKNR